MGIVGIMKTKYKRHTVRAEVFGRSHHKIRRMAKKLNISMPEAYEKLEQFGVEAILHSHEMAKEAQKRMLNLMGD